MIGAGAAGAVACPGGRRAGRAGRRRARRSRRAGGSDRPEVLPSAPSAASEPTCWTNGSLASKSVNDASWLVSTLTAVARGSATPATTAEPLARGGRDCGRDGCARRARGGSRRRSGGSTAPCFISFGPWSAASREEQHASDDQDHLLLLRLGGGGVLCASLGHQGVAPAATVPSEDVSVEVDGSGAGVAGTGALKA